MTVLSQSSSGTQTYSKTFCHLYNCLYSFFILNSIAKLFSTFLCFKSTFLLLAPKLGRFSQGLRSNPVFFSKLCLQAQCSENSLHFEFQQYHTTYISLAPFSTLCSELSRTRDLGCEYFYPFPELVANLTYCCLLGWWL